MVKPFEVARNPCLLVATLLAAACGSTIKSPQGPTVVRSGRGPAIVVVSAVQGEPHQQVQLALLQLALFIDAGTRDAAEPHAAAIAAELLGQRVGRDARARVLPDGLEVITICDDGLAACAGRLSRGLALRAPSPAAIARAHKRIMSGARSARASDPRRCPLLELCARHGLFQTTMTSVERRAEHRFIVAG